jgi:hypothetical protein
MLSTSPSLPFFEVIVNGTTRLSQWTPCVSIYQDINAHPIALLDVVYIGKNSNASGVGAINSWQYLAEDTPIQINYGQNPHFMYPFLGYVASYKLIRTGTDPGYAGQTMTRVQYTITGTSKVMQSSKNIAWKYTSPSAIAGNIANNNGFRGVIYNYVAAIDYRLQNSSDFKFLVQLANEIGFRFYVDNTDLYFINPQQILDRGNNRGTPQFWSYNQPGLYDTIRSFKPIVGTITPDGGVVANRNVIGLNPNTQQIVQASNIPTITASASSSEQVGTAITKYYNTAPAESYYEASQKVQADALNNLYWNTADTELYGDARVKPNALVNLVGPSLPTTEAGLWLVQSAVHNLTKAAPSGPRVDTTYTVNATLVRDKIYTASTTAISDTAPITQTVPATLVNGIWRSSNIGATIYAT